MRTDVYVFPDVFGVEGEGGVMDATSCSQSIKRPYWILGQDQHTLIIQCVHLIEWATAERIALAPWAPSVPPIPPDAATVDNVHFENLEETP